MKTLMTPIESEEICSLLDECASRVESGVSELLDWDQVKGSIGRR